MLSLSYDTNSSMSNEILAYFKNNNVKFGFWTVNNLNLVNSLINSNPYISFIASDYGYNLPIKYHHKTLVGLFTQNGLISWPHYLQTQSSPSNDIATQYEDFTISETQEGSKSYVITYKVPFLTDIFTNVGVVQPSILDYNKIRVVPIAHAQNNFGFTIEFIDNSSGDRLSLAEVYNLIGLSYINFSVSLPF